jgi:cbb3-type cytochrome oxidase subunit 3
MLKILAAEFDIGRLGEIGLLMFFAIFVIFTTWAFSRSRSQIRHWSNLPLGSDADENHPDQQNHL